MADKLTNNYLSPCNSSLLETPNFPHPFSNAFLESQNSLAPLQHPDTGYYYWVCETSTGIPGIFKFLFNITLLSRPKTDVNYYQVFLL